MHCLSLLFVCVQVFIIQSVLSQCLNPAPAPAYPAPIAPCGNGYGIRVSGDNLVINGTAQVSGSIPFCSSVQLDGEVPSEGSATLQSSCKCGDAVLASAV